MPKYEMQIVETRTGSLIIDTETLEEAFRETRQAYEDGHVFWHQTEQSFSIDQMIGEMN